MVAKLAQSPDWLLLPGHMCDAAMWAQTLAALTQAGANASVGDLTRDDTVEGMAARLLADAPDRFVVVGFSLGGIVALRMHEMAPERLAGLVLVDSNALPDLPERAAMRLRQQYKVRAGHLRSIVTEELKPHYLAPANRGRADILEMVLAMADRLGPDVFLRQSEAIRNRPDARPGLASIACPTLILGGADDQLCPPAWQHDLADAIPHAQLELVADAGHFLPVEQPASFIARLRVWAERTVLQH